MRKFDNYVKHKIIEVEGIKVPSISYDGYKPYVDWYIYCDADNDVYRVDCIDYAAKWIVEKRQNIVVHTPIDHTNNIVNVVILKDDIIRCGRTKSKAILEHLETLYSTFYRNTNLKDKVLQMGSKYGLSTNYIIRQI